MKQQKNSGQFGATLRRIRKSQKTTVKALASAMGVTPAAVNFWESGRYSPDFDTLCRIADYFNTSVDQLLNHSPISVSSGDISVTGVLNAPVGNNTKSSVTATVTSNGEPNFLRIIQSQQEEISALRRMLEKALERR